MDLISTLQSQYNIIIATSQSEDGYETEIHKIIDKEGKSYILKVYNFSQETWLDLQAENNILISLKSKLDYDLTFPILNIEGNSLTRIDNKIMRVLHYVEGDFWAKQIIENQFLISLGSSMATLDIELAKLEPGVIEKRNIDWDLNHLMNNMELINYVQDPVLKRPILYYFDQFENYTLKKLNALPKTLIHNDFNPWNVIMQDQLLSGLIDFGDMVYSARINELAVALAYVLAESDDFIQDTRLVLASYHNIYPLHKHELDLLYNLIAGRIITSLVHSAKGKQENPDNKYIQVSERAFRTLLHEWSTSDPKVFTNAAYKACNLN